MIKARKVITIAMCLLIALGGCNELPGNSSGNELSSTQTSIAAPSQSESILDSINSDTVSNSDSNTAIVKEIKTPWLEDYDTFWTIVEENYPLYSAAERITGNDFAVVKEKYRPQAAEATSAKELCEVIDLCVQQFNGTGHFWLAKNINAYRGIATLYGRLTDSPKCVYLYNRLNTPASIAYYGFDSAKEIETILENNGNETGIQSSGNLNFKDYPTDKTAYVSIAEMTAYFENDDGEMLADWFRTLETKGYQHCILDIRGNGGGSSSYWTDYIVMPNLMKPYRVTNYGLVRGQECIDYWQTAGRELQPISTLPRESLPALQQADLEGATHYLTYTKEWRPKDITPLFSGRFWLLVDEKVYSSSEMLAAFCKDTQFATLVGTRTGGDGIGEDPLTFALPNSGLCFRFSAHEGLNADGSCNEEYGTLPDIEIKTGEDALAVSLDAIRTTM